MKKIIIILSTVALLFTACDLDKYPLDSIEQSQSFKNVEDATQFNTGMYTFLRNRVYGIFMYSSDVQADLLNASKDFGNRNGTVYYWTFLASDYTIRDTWQPYYSAITNINNFLDNVDKIPAVSAAETATLSKYKGEAFLLRAYYYHQLVKLYSKDYEPTTAATDMGLPIVLRYDVGAKPSRSSVEATYAQILSDISQAKTLLTTSGTPGSINLTKDCIIALEARVYLCMHKYTEAASAADALISSNVYPLVSTVADLKNMWHSDANAETIFQLFASTPSELPTASNGIYLGYSSATKKYSPDFIPQQWVVDMYSDTDIRKSVYLDKKPAYIVSADYELYLINKYPGNPALYTGTTNYQHKPKVFRIAEMHLIKAEALAMTSSNDAQALSALNVLRTKRGLNALQGISGSALLDSIKVERTRELLCEGNRIEDLKRWKQDCVRKTPQNINVIMTGEDADKLNKKTGNDKFVWGIPENDMKANPNLNGQQNPGW